MDHLAGMIKRGFDENTKEHQKVFSRFDRFENDLKNLNETNSLDHEEIKLRLSQVAYQFELVEIAKRLKKSRLN